jgi:enterochelin esterase family protein
MDGLPVLYVLDGNDFSDPTRGALPHALDNLIADGRIEPLIAVFVGARNPAEPDSNRRETEFRENPDYAQFIAQELTARIDSAYRTDPNRRHLMGVSFGGLGTAYIGTQYPDVFQNLTLFSPSFWAADATFKAFDAMTAAPDWKVFVYWGQPEWDVQDLSDWIIGGLTAAGIEATGVQTAEGHSWATWRGITDEMLEYFYGSDG